MKNKAAQELGRKGGKAKTDAKSVASRINGIMGGRPGMYSVTQCSAGREQVTHGHALSKVSATILANALLNKGIVGIFVVFRRQTDGQEGYLNQGGGHDITGTEWNR